MKYTKLIYLFEGEIPKNFPFIHDKLIPGCLTIRIESTDKITNKMIKNTFNKFKEWYSNYIVY